MSATAPETLAVKPSSEDRFICSSSHPQVYKEHRRAQALVMACFEMSRADAKLTSKMNVRPPCRQLVFAGKAIIYCIESGKEYTYNIECCFGLKSKTITYYPQLECIVDSDSIRHCQGWGVPRAHLQPVAVQIRVLWLRALQRIPFAYPDDEFEGCDGERLNFRDATSIFNNPVSEDEIEKLLIRPIPSSPSSTRTRRQKPPPKLDTRETTSRTEDPENTHEDTHEDTEEIERIEREVREANDRARSQKLSVRKTIVFEGLRVRTPPNSDTADTTIKLNHKARRTVETKSSRAAKKALEKQNDDLRQVSKLIDMSKDAAELVETETNPKPQRVRHGARGSARKAEIVSASGVDAQEISKSLFA